jgi:hypothetical protein
MKALSCICAVSTDLYFSKDKFFKLFHLLQKLAKCISKNIEKLTEFLNTNLQP